MDPDYWRQRWTEGRTGWHQDAPTPLMVEHWPSLHLTPGGRVFVPLAGKSRDMRWFAAQGWRVLAVELSTLAVEQFFDESGVEPERFETRYGLHYRAGGIEIINGDVFGLDARALADCTAVYDRAALIALPPALRERYVREVYGCLPAGCRGLLITMEYPQHEKAGPPFSVPDAEVHARFDDRWRVEALDRRDILAQQPGFAAEGVTALTAAVYRLDRR